MNTILTKFSLIREKNLRCTTIVMLFIIVLVFLTSNCSMSDEDETLDGIDNDLILELNNSIHSIPEKPLETDDSQLEVLDFLKNSQIVGLGEATHGTREFFQMKFRIFKYLVEKHGFKIFGFEADFAESIYIDRYITTGEGDLRQLMKTKMHFWVWRTEEVYELLEWMRQYNKDKSRKDMIRYFGFDCQFNTYQADLLMEYLETVSLQYLETVKEFLKSVPTHTYSKYDNTSVNEDLERYLEFKNQLEAIYNYISHNELEFVTASDNEKYIISKQLVRTLIQTNEILYIYYVNGSSISNSRDIYMAENALWLQNLINKDTKIALWAHNGHIANDPTYRGDSMGKVIRDTLGAKYQNIAFSFSSGFFTARTNNDSSRELTIFEMDAPPQANSTNRLFYSADQENFIFILKDLKQNSKLQNWFMKDRYFLTIGSNWPCLHYRPINYDYYNIIIHYDTTNESILFGH